ncbi:hypothetical protein B7463_g12039, partial [Scytalidium lignicola]
MASQIEPTKGFESQFEETSSSKVALHGEKVTESTANLSYIVEHKVHAGDARDVLLEPARLQWDTLGWLRQLEETSGSKTAGHGNKTTKPTPNLSDIVKDEFDDGDIRDISFKKTRLQWDRPGWLRRLEETSGNKTVGYGCRATKSTTNLSDIVEDEGYGDDEGDVSFETVQPQWDRPGWLTEILSVKGFWPDVVVHNASTLNNMMAADENITLSIAEWVIRTRSRPFARGNRRAASYARTAASTNRFVVKSFLKGGGKGLAYFVEDMRIQALCKAFALEFNSLLKNEHLIDFTALTCLLVNADAAAGDGCLSLEPFIQGEYTIYNNNTLFVKKDSPDDQFNRVAQAFSHFTFERSWDDFLINYLHSVANLLTDPSIQTRDPNRFKLSETNLNEEGFKFFFAMHKCNEICRKLKLKSTGEMLASGNLEFRERWPAIDPMVCCSNKLCRRIICLATAHKSTKFPRFHWCDMCWPQLESTAIRWYCLAPGPDHEFDVSKFFYESQGKAMPRKCPEHQEKDGLD